MCCGAMFCLCYVLVTWTCLKILVLDFLEVQVKHFGISVTGFVVMIERLCIIKSLTELVVVLDHSSFLCFSL